MRKVRILFIAVVLVAGAACEKKSSENASEGLVAGVIGGSAEKKNSDVASMTVALRDTKTHVPFCSATIIAPRMLLTAAHCLPGATASGIEAAFDVKGGNTTAVVGEVKAIWAHEGFQSALEECPKDESHWNCSGKNQIARVGTRNDLALVLLEKEIPAGFKSVRVADGVAWRALLPNVKLAGFGISTALAKFNVADEKEISAHSGRLHSVEQSGSVVMEGVDISEKYQSILVHVKKRSSMCNGDSGGPLFVQDDRGLLQVGVASYLFEGDSTMPCWYRFAVYTDVSRHAKWIEATSAKLLAGQTRPPSSASIGVSVNHPRMLEAVALKFKMTCSFEGAPAFDADVETDGRSLASMRASYRVGERSIETSSKSSWTEVQSSINLSHDVFGADDAWESSGDRGRLLKVLFHHQPLGLSVADPEGRSLTVNEDSSAFFDVTSASASGVVLEAKGVEVAAAQGEAKAAVKAMDCSVVLTLKNPEFWP